MDNGPAYTPKWIFTWHQSHPCAETGQKCKDWNVLFSISQFQPFDHEKPCASTIEDESLSRNHYFFSSEPATHCEGYNKRQTKKAKGRKGRQVYTVFILIYRQWRERRRIVPTHDALIPDDHSPRQSNPHKMLPLSFPSFISTRSSCKEC